MVLEQYVAIADYQKQNRAEVNMVAGDVVEVIDKNENGKSRHHPGFPELKHPIKTILIFHVQVLECFGSDLIFAGWISLGWWFVNVDEEQGWVPGAYLEPADGSEDVNERIPEGQGWDSIDTVRCIPHLLPTFPNPSPIAVMSCQGNKELSVSLPERSFKISPAI